MMKKRGRKTNAKSVENEAEFGWIGDNHPNNDKCSLNNLLRCNKDLKVLKCLTGFWNESFQTGENIIMKVEVSEKCTNDLELLEHSFTLRATVLTSPCFLGTSSGTRLCMDVTRSCSLPGTRGHSAVTWSQGRLLTFWPHVQSEFSASRSETLMIFVELQAEWRWEVK